MDTVKTESAVHVARLVWQEQAKFAAGNTIAAADTVLGLARRADIWVASLDLQRRNQRLHAVELTDRAKVFAEGGTTEQAVDDEGRSEVAEREARRPQRPVP